MYRDDFDQILVESIREFDALPPRSQVAYCLLQLEAEVNNGGFHQFFSNASGLLALQTLDALSKIEAPKTRTLLEGAIRIAYPGGYPNDALKHDTELADSDEVYDELESLDEKFYAYEEPLMELVNKYLET